ncbi:tetratricopeptide repeat protein [Botrimarina sp.]|uniref:tetratricopeptide repeat protein n=1 Tax=Botrimarina sp. TaxID=2795802 RepID=UPI0032ECA327
MAILAWLKSRFSSSGHAEWLYRRGMLRAKLGRVDEAVADYTAVVETAAAPPRVRAMALYNRAIVLYSTGHAAEAGADLKKILSMNGAPAHVRTEARRKLTRVERAAERNDRPDT